MKSVLFIGMYPNAVDIYRNVFFQNLIFAIADSGVECTVISPVSITKYRCKIKRIPKSEIQHTPMGTKVQIYYPRYISTSSIQIMNFNTERLSEKLFSNAAYNSAYRLSKEGKLYDCVYGHFFLFGGLAAIRVGKMLRIPSFLAYGECDFESQVNKNYGIPKPKQLEGLSGIISVSTKNTKELENLGIVKNVPIITAPNATNLTLFYKKDKRESREMLKLPQNIFIVGFVGGFIERKGDKRLLEAVNRISGVFVAFAGRGDNPPTGEKVIMCKALDHKDVSTFLNAIDVFCLPTLNEGSCNSIIEAMACGCPIISSNLPFNDDILNDDNSIRLDPYSIDEIKSAIETLYLDEKRRERLSTKSLNTAKAFDIEHRASKIIRFIDLVIKSE